MAKIGLENLKFGKLDETNPTAPKYDGAKSFGRAIDCKVSIETNNAELYADNCLAESDYSFKKGTVTLTVDEENESVFSEILGHSIGDGYEPTKDTVKGEKTYYTYDSSKGTYTKFMGGSFVYGTTYYEAAPNKGEMIRKDTDVAPYVALGRILEKVVNGVRKYKVEFLSKIKFKEPSQEDKSRGENLEFATTTVEGTIMKLADGTWSRSQTFSNKEEAKTYLDNLLKKTI